MTLVPVVRRQRKVDLSKFKASLIYKKSSRAARATEKPCLKKTTTKQNKIQGLSQRDHLILI